MRDMGAVSRDRTNEALLCAESRVRFPRGQTFFPHIWRDSLRSYNAVIYGSHLSASCFNLCIPVMYALFCGMSNYC